MHEMRNQKGVAMVTVLLVGMVMTVATSVAAFTTINELKAGTDDQRGTQALAHAEAGVDRLLQYLRQGAVTWHKLIRAGCEDPSGLSVPNGSVGTGGFQAVLKVFEPNPSSGNSADQYAPGACNYRAADPNDPQGQMFVITSKGTTTGANRSVQQIVEIEPIGLPVGLTAPSIDANGNPNLQGISMFTDGQLKGREKLVFSGLDSYYRIQDVFPDGVVGRSPTDFVPAGAHALGGIYMKQNGSQPEFPGSTAPTTRNCIANGTGGQSLWDSDGSSGTGTVTAGCSGQTGYPVNSKFTSTILSNIVQHAINEVDHTALREAARANGIYCIIGSTTTCTRQGSAISPASVWNDAEFAPIFSSGTNNFVAYFEFLQGAPLSNVITWHGNVGPCHPTNPDLSKSAVVVVRRGSLHLNAGTYLNGAVIVDGELKFNGNAHINGTVISQSGFWIRGGSTFSMDPCWVKNMPGSFLTATPISWGELDR